MDAFEGDVPWDELQLALALLWQRAAREGRDQVRVWVRAAKGKATATRAFARCTLTACADGIPTRLGLWRALAADGDV